MEISFFKNCVLIHLFYFIFRGLGGVVCVRCEHKATRDYLGGRCGGHGVPGRITRWTSLTNVECHGKWLRRPDESHEVSSSTCSCDEDALLIFV
jgi:hypothetical protein